MTGERQGHRDVLPGGERGDQVERLEHEPDLLAPVLVELSPSEPGDVGLAELDGAAGRCQDPAETRQQCGLAAPRWAEQHDQFAGAGLERQVIERADGVAVVDEFDDEIAHVEWSGGHAAPENA
jgi:hypothetical protein